MGEELTQNEYNALSNSEKFSGKLFFIIDQGYIYKNDVIYGGTSNSGKIFKNGVQYGRNSHARIYKNGIEYAVGIIIVEIPTVTIGSYTYTGSAQGPTITGLDTEHCTVTNATKTLPGTYTMTISLNDTNGCVWSDGTTTPKTYKYTIKKVSVALPVFSNMSYQWDGSAHSPTVTYNSTYCNISGNGARTDVGSQTVTVSLKDTSLTMWTDGTTANKTATFSITKASVALPTFSNMTYTYDGNAHSPTVTYNSTYCNISGNGARTNAGSQTVTVSLKSTTNTQWSDGTIAAKTATFTINKANLNINVTYKVARVTVCPLYDDTSGAYMDRGIVNNGEIRLYINQLDSVKSLIDGCHYYGLSESDDTLIVTTDYQYASGEWSDGSNVAIRPNLGSIVRTSSRKGTMSGVRVVICPKDTNNYNYFYLNLPNVTVSTQTVI